MTLFLPTKDNGIVINHVWIPAYNNLTSNTDTVGTVTTSGTRMNAYSGSQYNYGLFNGAITMGPNETNTSLEGTATLTLNNSLSANNYKFDITYDNTPGTNLNRILYGFSVTLVYDDNTELVVASNNTQYGVPTNITWTFYGTATKNIKAIKFYIKGNVHASMGVIGMKMYAQKEVECSNHTHYAITRPKYMKKTVVENDFIQPVLSANGTWGGLSFSVNRGSVWDSPYEAFKALNNNTNDFWQSLSVNTANDWIGFYNPIPLKVTNLQIQNSKNTGYNVHAITSGRVEVSNNGVNWTTLKSFTNSTTGFLTTWNIDLSDNSNAYKYYRIMVIGSTSSICAIITELDITAVEQVITYTESTSNDYNYIEHKNYIIRKD